MTIFYSYKRFGLVGMPLCAGRGEDAAVGVCLEVSIVATLGRSVVLLTVEVGLEQFSEIQASDSTVVHKNVNCTYKSQCIAC